MSNQYIDREPSNKFFRVNKHTLDKIKKHLDRMRREQAEIYSSFKRKYDKKQITDIITEQEMRELEYEVREIGNISDQLIRVDYSSRRYSY